MITLLQSILAVLSAALGAFFATWANISHKHLCALISFAAGTLFATAIFHIVPEALLFASPAAVLIALLSGYLLFYLISRYVFHVCPACSASHFEEHKNTAISNFSVLLGIALSIHIFMDGIALALGKELGHAVDFSLLLTILIHKFPEGLALCALNLKSGMEKKKAQLFTIGIEALTLAGWLVGALVLQGFKDNPWIYLFLVHVAGGFVYLSLHAVLNESKQHAARFILVFFLIGISVIGLSRFLIH